MIRIEDAAGLIAGLIVLPANPEHVLLDIVAVRPERQGQGAGAG